MEPASSIDEQVYGYVKESCLREESFHFLQFEFLQRANIVYLQNKLAKLKSRVHDKQSCPEEAMLELQHALDAYARAIRNYADLHAHPPLKHSQQRSCSLRLERHFPSIASSPGRPFDSHYARLDTSYSVRVPIDSIRTFLRQYLPLAISYSAVEKIERRHEYESGKPPLGISASVDRAARFLVALTSGAFLLVPTVIMLQVPGVHTGLITVCVAVLLFTTALAFGVRASNVETMVATATYAAVLVVFVGTSTSSPS